VGSRTEDLAHANRLLEKNLLSLEAAQERLIQAEKLASLGSLVAGVAHELNTPIGNALTVVSTLNDKHREIKAIFHDGALKKSTFDSYIQTIEDASELLETNITRAANLISSFKTIAVNQTNEARCRFDLRRLLLALEPSLRLQLQRKKIDLQIELEQEVELDSYPGAITQIILNLHANAVVHAFEHTEAGRIRIQVSPDPGNAGRILMRLSDNGAGISKSNLSKVFDPFFTTKLGQGGSGLGLHICYNIAKNILGGHISVESNHEGTVFLIYIALIAPLQQKSLDS
jgi:two-component system NtrC family sensor kinase